MKAAFRVGVLCGGPSRERGISLNSARSLSDHLGSQGVEIVPFYVDRECNFYALSPAQLYSNTPADFDFKLAHLAEPLSPALLRARLEAVDIVFPAIHGSFGEDGQLQALLEKWQIPYVGSSAEVCPQMYFKNRAAKKIAAAGFTTLASTEFHHEDSPKQRAQKVDAHFARTPGKKSVVKPMAGGSSIGVSVAPTAAAAVQAITHLLSQDPQVGVLLEPFCQGREFTVVVVAGQEGLPVALIPTEIEVSYADNQVFDYRRKYLPTSATSYHTPPRFEVSIIQRIQEQAEELFRLFGMRDFARIDGWLLDDGRILFSDFNPISGMEQNSFLFRQAAVVGMSHASVLLYIVDAACRRAGLAFTPQLMEKAADRQPVAVLFGGRTAERQVSLMSGTNCWLKLRNSARFYPRPYLLDRHLDVWELPYAYTLNHTVEEIFDNCSEGPASKEKTCSLVAAVRGRLAHFLEDTHGETTEAQRFTLDEFIKNATRTGTFVFLALHGGEGEDGTLQRRLEQAKLGFNGSAAKASALCMDKYLSAEVINGLKHPNLGALHKENIGPDDCVVLSQPEVAVAKWQELQRRLGAGDLLIKPRFDGCSAGIVRLQSGEDLATYARLVNEGTAFIPAGTFSAQTVPIEMPGAATTFMIEPFISCDKLHIEGKRLEHQPREGWLELTVGVLEAKGVYTALQPSITIAEGAVLSLEEKFQGGTGVNITPPPASLLSAGQIAEIRRCVEVTAAALGIGNYARIDIFYNRTTNRVVVIEANSLPALTPSTVLFHQGLAEVPALSPLALLEKIIQNSILPLIPRTLPSSH